jgi:NADH-quinone oxidoreductase subunit C/D
LIDSSQTVTSGQTYSLLTDRFSTEALEVFESFGELNLVVAPDDIPTVLIALRDEPAFHFELLVDIVGIDCLGLNREYRFEVVYVLASVTSTNRLMVRSRLDTDPPTVPSSANIYNIADWLEREVFDQFGIVFKDHPNLKRLLNHIDFEGHPLRKDYPINKLQELTTSDPLMDEMCKKLLAAGRSVEGISESKMIDIEDAVVNPDETLFLVNLGPSHPIVHGILRLLLAVEGETIIAAVPEIGYLHRGMEKGAEAGNYHQVIPFTDRLNYASPISNNIGYCKAIERMLNIDLGERDVLLRVIFLEINRIMDHLLCIGPHLIDLGALTPFWYLFQIREQFYDIFEKYSGARLTYSCVRIGYMPFTLQSSFSEDVESVLKRLATTIDEVRGLVERNRIFYDRCVNVGKIDTKQALSHGFTGPVLRATGLDHDLRKTQPYYGYERFDFQTIVGTNGDTYDRFFVRVYEMIESTKIIRQALTLLEAQPSIPNSDMKTTKGFKKVAPPAGEIYDCTEAPNGELGFYVVSDGSVNPYRLKVRSPSLCNYSAIERLCEGAMIADLVAIVGSLNVIGGEIDR